MRTKSLSVSFGETLLGFLSPFGVAKSASQLFELADLCSRLAKLATGSTRGKLYQYKNRYLAAIVVRHPELIHSRSDHQRYPGLLSISLRHDLKRRLHTHENWLRAA